MTLARRVRLWQNLVWDFKKIATIGLFAKASHPLLTLRKRTFARM